MTDRFGADVTLDEEVDPDVEDKDGSWWAG
jgi:hypothetical protein